MKKSSSWINYFVAGVGMILISNLIFGGIVFTFLTTSQFGFPFIMFLVFGGISTVMSGILMIYDSLKVKVKNDISEQKEKKCKTSEVKNHIKVLHKEADRLKPEKYQKTEA